MTVFINGSKVATGAFWLLWLALVSGLVQLIPALDSIVIPIGWVILGAHVIETGIYSFRAPSRGGFQFSDALQVFVFGVFHLIPVSFSDKK